MHNPRAMRSPTKQWSAVSRNFRPRGAVISVPARHQALRQCLCSQVKEGLRGAASMILVPNHDDALIYASQP